MAVVLDYYGNRFEEETLFDPEVMKTFIVGEWIEGAAGGVIYALTDDQMMRYLAGANLNSACHSWCMPSPVL